MAVSDIDCDDRAYGLTMTQHRMVLQGGEGFGPLGGSSAVASQEEQPGQVGCLHQAHGTGSAGRGVAASSSAPPLCSAVLASAVPSPYQPGRLLRFCVQEKTQGIARRSSIEPRLLRLTGREASVNCPSTSIGVA